MSQQRPLRLLPRPSAVFMLIMIPSMLLPGHRTETSRSDAAAPSRRSLFAAYSPTVLGQTTFGKNVGFASGVTPSTMMIQVFSSRLIVIGVPIPVALGSALLFGAIFAFSLILASKSPAALIVGVSKKG